MKKHTPEEIEERRNGNATARQSCVQRILSPAGTPGTSACECLPKHSTTSPRGMKTRQQDTHVAATMGECQQYIYVADMSGHEFTIMSLRNIVATPIQHTQWRYSMRVAPRAAEPHRRRRASGYVAGYIICRYGRQARLPVRCARRTYNEYANTSNGRREY